MDWVSIDQEKCTQCSQCVEICVRGCLAESKGEVFFQGDDQCCNLCGHCVAVCPTAAVFHHRTNPQRIIDFDGSQDLSHTQLIKFLGNRRSHRHFEEKDISTLVLEALVDACRLAPTGSNAQSVELLIVKNEEIRKKLSDLTIEYFRRRLQEIEAQSRKYLNEKKTPPDDLIFELQKTPMVKRLIRRWETGRDPILWDAPVTMIFHSPTRTSTPKDNCVLAAHTMALTAMTLGIGTCFIGLLEAAANGSSSIRKVLNLPEAHRVYSVLILGYPVYEFQRTVDRKPIATQWS